MTSTDTIENGTIIDNVAVFDATGTPTRAASSIAILDGRIAWLADAGVRPVGWESAAIIDATGLTATPGLFDCHTHLTFDSDPNSFVTLERSPVKLMVIAMANLKAHLASGVTTVRDCGSFDRFAIELSRAIARGDVAGPRVLAAGLVLTMTGGHGHFIGNLVDGVDSGTRAARTEIAAGADFIKVMATGGVLTEGVSTGQVGLQEPELAAIVTAAHGSGKRVTAHATGLQGTLNALAAGVDSIEHGMELNDEAVALAAEQKTILVPTLSAIAGLSDHQDLLPDWMANKVDDARTNIAKSFALATAAGVRIAAGTDAGTPFNYHGGLGREVVMMTAFGMTAADAMIAATRTSAENLGLEQSLGTLEVGKTADLVLFGGDPTEHIESVHDVRVVFKEGEVVWGSL